MTPEEALARAREAAQEQRSVEDAAELARLSEIATARGGRVTRARLYEWALIEPDLTLVRSTRRFGAPMVALKRLLLRLLAQYHADLIAQQTRLNVHLVHELAELEDRLAALEDRARPQP